MSTIDQTGKAPEGPRRSLLLILPVVVFAVLRG